LPQSPNPLISHDHFQLSWENVHYLLLGVRIFESLAFFHCQCRLFGMWFCKYALLIPSISSSAHSKCTLTPSGGSSQWHFAEGKACQDLPKLFVCSKLHH